VLKSLYDRLCYAAIGFVLGAVVGIVLWFLYDFGASTRVNAPSIHAGLRQWVFYAGGFFAAIGLLFGSHVGTAVGTTSNELYRYESQRHGWLPVRTWFAAVILIVVALAVWHYAK
jgi:predicted lysophospholipase L1 biosynthesis ABC-type transport system permease subunit